MSTQLPDTVTYGTVTGQLVTAVLDGVDADSNPDMAPIRGSITFTLNPTSDYLRESTANIIVIPQPITIPLDANGGFSITLIATDTPGLVEAATYTVTFNLVGFAPPDLEINVSGGTTQDLSNLFPTPII